VAKKTKTNTTRKKSARPNAMKTKSSRSVRSAESTKTTGYASQGSVLPTKSIAKKASLANRRSGTGESRATISASPEKTGTKGNNAARRAAASATSQDPIQFPEERRTIPKSPLTAKELREFKKLLVAKRDELYGDVERLTSEALNSDGVGGEQSNMPIHMADLGSDNWEREFTLGLIAGERALVREIDEALERIENKTYGVCLGTLNPIDKARLRAKPWAKYCIEYARAREEGRVP
jgi:RNA polymerase-binding transcription factor DksA